MPNFRTQHEIDILRSLQNLHDDSVEILNFSNGNGAKFVVKRNRSLAPTNIAVKKQGSQTGLRLDHRPRCITEVAEKPRILMA